MATCNIIGICHERWLILFIFCLLQIGNAILWITFAPISNLAQHYFGGSDTTDGTKTSINMLANIFLVIYPFGSIFGFVLSKYAGPRVLMILAAACTALGALLRYIAAVNIHHIGEESAYGLIFFGQSVAALAFPLIFNFVSALSSIWFPVEERDIATTFASMSNPVGVAIGQVIPVLFVIKAGGKENDDSDDNYSVLGMNDLLFTEFIYCLVPLVGMIIFFKDAPQVHASNSSRLKSESTPRSSYLSEDTGATELIEDMRRMKAEIYELLQDRNYLLLLFGFSIGVGSINALITLINQLVEPFGYSNTNAGTFGSVLIVVGLVGAAITSKIMQKTKAFIPILRIGIVLCCSSILFVLAMLYSNNFWPLLIAFGTLGGFSLPLLPLLIENSAECTYPISEEVSFGLLNIGANVIGIGIVFALQFLIDVKEFGPPPLLPSNLLIVCLLIIVLYLLISFNGEYKRLNVDQPANPSTANAADRRVGIELVEDQAIMY